MRLISVLVLATAAAAAAPPDGDSFSALRARFAEPPAAYSTMPFFVWNGEMSEAVIDRQLADFHKQGVDGLFIHPRPGMITDYMSDRWFALVRYTVLQAKKLGMEVWLYDENSYPSGFGGGHVPAEMPESYNEGQGLTLRKLDSLASGDAAKCKVLLEKSGDSYQDVTAGAATQSGSGEYACFEPAFYEKGGWFGGFSYVDLIKPGVTEKFIDVTMRGYERSLGADLGRTVPGIFTDEPNIAAPKNSSVRWTPDFFAQFQKRRGYDVRPRLVAMFEEAGDWRKVRHDYYATLLELFVERWSKPWHAYSQKSGVQWTGHYWEHEWPKPNQGPDNMAMYAWEDRPGIDMLFNQFSEEKSDQFGNVRSVKELASVANQLGRRRTLSETYGGGGWDLRFEDMKRLGDWEYVLGVNFMNQHLGFQTLAGARKYDYPQSFTYHEPWWNHYGLSATYFRRLSLALSTGEQVNRTLVIEPTTSAWMYARVKGEDEHMAAMEHAFRDLVNRLEAAQAEYDIGSEYMIKEHGKSEGKKLRVGRREYELVVLAPTTENLESTTVTLLENYLKAGGVVLALTEPPARVDGVASAFPAELASRYATQWIRAASADDSAAKQLLLNGDFAEVTGKLYHQRRHLTDGELLFFVNSSLDAAAGAKVKTAGRSLMRLDAVTGAVAPYPARLENGRLAFAVDLPPANSLLLVASNSGVPAAEPAKPGAESAVEPAAPMMIKRASPNMIRIDYCDLTIGGKTDEDVDFYRAADKVFKAHGLSDGDPWNHAVQYKTSLLDQNHFAPDSGFDAVFHFDLDAGVNTKTLEAVVERPALWQVLVNGSVVKARPGAWRIDREFGVYDIGGLVKAGRNDITLKAHPMSIHAELEPVYVVGDFGVTAQDKGFRITASQDLKTGPWSEQKLPFYSDVVAYSRSYRLRPGSTYKVSLGKWLGTVAEVKVNGKSAGVIGWAPYEVDVTKLVRSGRNDVEVLVYGSLKNLLGPHHGKIVPGFVTPWSWRNQPEHMPPGKDYDFLGYGLFEDFRLTETASR